MAFREEHEGAIRRVQIELGNVTAINIDSVVRETDLGLSNSFISLRGPLSVTYAVASDLRNSNVLLTLGLDALEKLFVAAGQLRRAIGEVAGYTPEADHGRNRRDQVERDFFVKYQAFVDLSSRFYSLELGIRFRPDTVAQKIEARLDTFRPEIQNLIGEAKRLKEGCDAALDSFRQASAESGVLTQSAHFKSEAVFHKSEADKWWWAVWAISGLLIAYGGVILVLAWFTIPAMENLVGTIQFLIAKVLIFFVLASAYYFSIRNYNAHRHSWVQNRHRDAAVRTFQAFADATKSAEARDIILQYASACIYMPQESGFIKSDNGSSVKSIGDLLPTIQRVAGTSHQSTS